MSGNNPDKDYIFTARERALMLRETVINKGLKNVEVFSYEGKTVDFARSKSILVMARGIRDARDLIYESKLASDNADIDPGIQTIFLVGCEFPDLHSSEIRDLARSGEDFSGFVPENVMKEVYRKLQVNRGNPGDGGQDVNYPDDFYPDYQEGIVFLMDKRNNCMLGEAIVDWENYAVTIRRFLIYNRGAGLGTIFYSKLEADAIRDGFTDIFVEPRKDEATGLPYENAVKFWEKRGFSGYFIMRKMISKNNVPKDGGAGIYSGA